MKKLMVVAAAAVVLFGSVSIGTVYAGCDIRHDNTYVDGCSGPWLPNVHISGFNADAKKLFQSACNKHDQCYHSCNCGKDFCDDVFRGDMTAICDKNYPYNPITVLGRDVGDKNAPVRTMCYSAKDSFYGAVRAGGQGSYANAQKRVGCGINKTKPAGSSGKVLAGCNIRRDNTYVDGCSGPWLPNVHIRGFNADAKKLFQPACNKHDQCYHSCGCGKDFCDNVFRGDMTAICDKIYPYNPVTVLGKNVGDKNAPVRTMCYSAKDTFYGAVRAGGQGSYDNAQRRVGCNVINVKPAGSVGQR